MNSVGGCGVTAEGTGGGAGFTRIRRDEADRGARGGRQQYSWGFRQRRSGIGQLLMMRSRVAECIDEAQLLSEDGVVSQTVAL